MGNSLMLRTGAGRLAGYVQDTGSVIRCKLMPEISTEPVQVTVMFQNGNEEQHEVQAGGEEAEWAAQGEKLTGAYAAVGGSVLCATDENARFAALNRLKTAHVKSAGGEERRAAVKGTADTAVKRPDPPEFDFPERRWPPPPCCPQARYEQGRWTTYGEWRNGVLPYRGGT